jgi:hypothetical protein
MASKKSCNGSVNGSGTVEMIAVAALLAGCGGSSTPRASVPKTGASSGHPASGSPVAVEGGLRNVRVSHNRFGGHIEPDVAVNPSDSRNLLAASQIVVGPHLIVPGAYASWNGGETWRDDGPLPMPGGFPGGADTTVAFDSRGNGYVASPAYDRAGDGTPSRTRTGEILLSRTSDGGRSFAAPAVVYRERGSRIIRGWR